LQAICVALKVNAKSKSGKFPSLNAAFAEICDLRGSTRKLANDETLFEINMQL